MALVTIKRVPLMRVGTWAASTGETRITREDLDNIVESAASGELDKAVIKIGHTDPRFTNPDWDGEPAYGQVSNLTADGADGGTLYGDFVNVPEELAAKLPSAYPFRSVEISWGVKLKDATGKVAKTFKAVLTGLALLGASAPAVKGLGDVHAALSEETAEARYSTAFTYKADTPAVPPAETPGNHSEHVLAPEGTTQAKTTKEVTTVALLEKYRKQLGLPETATAEDILAALDKADSDGDEKEAPKEEPKKDEPAKEQPDEDGELPSTGDPSPTPSQKKKAPAKEPAMALSEKTEPTPSVTVSAVAFAAMQNDVAALRAQNAEFKAREDEKRRNGIIRAALSEGRLHPTEEQTWRQALDSNEEVTVSLLSSRQPMFSVTEFGHDLAPSARDAQSTVLEAQLTAENALFGIGEK